MNTVYNPLTGNWERVDDVVRPLPVIARDTRLVAANDTTTIIPSLGSSNSPAHTDLFGNTSGSRANIGIAVGSTDADVVILDPWRIRRLIVVCNRTASGSTSVGITCTVFGRLLSPDGTPTPWRQITNATDTGTTAGTIRFALPGSLSGVFGFDQYRITFRRDQASDPAPELSLIRLYAEF
jgi:hypothetical protein